MSAVPDAETFARAIIASAISYGDDPLAACAAMPGSNHRRALAPATYGLAQATGAPRLQICRILGVSSEGSRQAKSHGGERFRKAMEAAAEATRYHLRGRKIAARAQACAAAEVGPVEEPAPEVVAEPEPEPVAAAPAAPEVPAVAVIAAPPAPRPAPRPAPKPAAKPSGRAMPKGARFVNLGEGVTRIEMRPIPERVARMAKQQLDRGADLIFIADCFDTSPEALQAAINALEQGEAA